MAGAMLEKIKPLCLSNTLYFIIPDLYYLRKLPSTGSQVAVTQRWQTRTERETIFLTSDKLEDNSGKQFIHK